MTIEELKAEERRLWKINQQKIDESMVTRDAWYEALVRWQHAVEEEKINALVEERIKAKV